MPAPRFVVINGTGTLAGEEEDGRLEMIVTLPLPRWQIVTSKALAFSFTAFLILVIVSLASGAVFLAIESQLETDLSGGLMATAEARLGRPATPVSYAGVARRTTVRAATPGVGAGGIGGPASGVGVLPGAGAGKAGVGYSGGVGPNLGGPVNRVGVR